jgi:hypothetical protein
MGPFRFGLQRLLDLRSAAERAQAAVMEQARAEADRRRVQSSQEADHLATIEEQASDAKAIPAGLRHVWGLSAEAARVRLLEADNALREAEDSRQAEQDRFSEARMARRSLERLRERQAADWWVEYGRQEQADSDEIARQQNAKEDRE